VSTRSIPRIERFVVTTLEGQRIESEHVYSRYCTRKVTMQPVLEAIAITAAVKLRWPGFDPDRSRMFPTTASRIEFPVFLDEPRMVSAPVGWRNAPGVKALLWRILWRLTGDASWGIRGKVQVFEDIPVAIGRFTLEPRPVAGPLVADYDAEHDLMVIKCEVDWNTVPVLA
jgi:hypothetical protein